MFQIATQDWVAEKEIVSVVSLGLAAELAQVLIMKTRIKLFFAPRVTYLLILLFYAYNKL